ncbi:hypothetical protein [Chamaesiphon polymorphus]|nr:hypothetical protein [Chamaesiphon polymorphus]
MSVDLVYDRSALGWESAGSFSDPLLHKMSLVLENFDPIQPE